MFFEGLCMKISELIKELEGMLEKWGDLEVVKGRDYVGSEEVTGITTIHGDCYIENKYLDNYTMRNEDKLACVKWKINMMQNCIHKLEYELRQANEY